MFLHIMAKATEYTYYTDMQRLISVADQTACPGFNLNITSILQKFTGKQILWDYRVNNCYKFYATSIKSC